MKFLFILLLGLSTCLWALAEDFQRPFLSYAWKKGANGYGYCYRVNSLGHTLDHGRIYPDEHCEAVSPAQYVWDQDADGFTFCYKESPNGLRLQHGRPVENERCL